MKKFFKNSWQLIKETGSEFSDDNATTFASALSFNTLFSLAPILIILIAVGGMIFGRQAVEGQVFTQFKSFLGVDGAKQLQDLLKSAYQPGKSIITTIIALLLLIFGATSVFYQLQMSLNTIWQVKPKPKKSFLKYLRDRVLSFGLIIAIGFLLLVSFGVSALLTGFSNYLSQYISKDSVIMLLVLDIMLSLTVITFLFALIYKVLPDANIRWRDVWVGSGVTAALFIISKYLIGIYLSNSNIGSTYGAAGFVVLILLWVYYSSMMLFLGAEFTKAWTTSYGKPIEPAQYAVRIKSVEIVQVSTETTIEFEQKVDVIEDKANKPLSHK
jgi:membrane protein